MCVKDELRSLFTNYWHYLSLRTACQLNLFDVISAGDNTIASLTTLINVDSFALNKLISHLEEYAFIYIDNSYLFLTEKGEILTDHHPDSIKQSCILWGGEHMSAWQNLEYTVRTGESSFENTLGLDFFDFIKTDSRKLQNYHKAMAEYARDDYSEIANVIDFSSFKNIVDLGGGLGVLINNIAMKNPNLNCCLFDKEEVINLVAPNVAKNVKLIKGDFFDKLLVKADALILSRVIHDWSDYNAKLILDNCFDVLQNGDKIFIIEIMNDEIDANLLSLNMMAVCRSYERTFSQYVDLLEKSNFKMTSKIKLNGLQTIIIAEKYEIQ